MSGDHKIESRPKPVNIRDVSAFYRKGEGKIFWKSQTQDLDEFLAG